MDVQVRGFLFLKVVPKIAKHCLSKVVDQILAVGINKVKVKVKVNVYLYRASS